MLESQTCLVTGAARGIGRAIATEFGKHGADVAVNYRSSAAEAIETPLEAVEFVEQAGEE
ncbi:MAG: 3-oxoacyl-[acyl-carrier protein] reductase [Natronomonas sp.]|jgi:3-oxoacyl-[acyl-carrier protein] reductase